MTYFLGAEIEFQLIFYGWSYLHSIENLCNEMVCCGKEKYVENASLLEFVIEII